MILRQHVTQRALEGSPSVLSQVQVRTHLSLGGGEFDCGPDEIGEVGSVNDTGFVLVSQL